MNLELTRRAVIGVELDKTKKNDWFSRLKDSGNRWSDRELDKVAKESNLRSQQVYVANETEAVEILDKGADKVIDGAKATTCEEEIEVINSQGHKEQERQVHVKECVQKHSKEFVYNLHREKSDSKQLFDVDIAPSLAAAADKGVISYKRILKENGIGDGEINAIIKELEDKLKECLNEEDEKQGSARPFDINKIKQENTKFLNIEELVKD